MKRRAGILGMAQGCWGLLLSVLFCSAAPCFAQVGTASVAGIVEDVTGARVGGAQVRLMNAATGAENDATTNRYGVFVLPGVIPGGYVLEVLKPGFATERFEGITLNIGDSKQFLIRMSLSAVRQTVTVNAAGLTLNTTNGAIGTVVDRRFVQNMPLNGRSLQGLITMTPGVTTESPQSAGLGDYSINGQRPDTNSYIVDGVSGNLGTGRILGPRKVPGSGNDAATTALGTTQSIVPLDALGEFQVLNSSYSAEYGRALGSQFILLTRSGTNQLHGEVYDYQRNSVLDAFDWFTQFNSLYNVDLSFHQDDFGGVIGGPVTLSRHHSGKSKTFFAASHETIIVFQPSAPLVEFTPNFRLFYEEGPTVLRPILGRFPPPLCSGCGVVPPRNTAMYLDRAHLGAISLPSSLSSTSVRIDHNFSPRTSAFFRFGDTPSDSQAINLSSLSQLHMRTRTFMLGVNTQMASSRDNSFRFGYGATTTRMDTWIDPLYVAVGWPPVPPLGQSMGIPASYDSSRAEFYIRAPGIGESYIDTDHATESLRQWNLRDTYSLDLGRHFLSLGIDQRRVASGVTPPAVSVRSDYFSSDALLANSADDVAVTRAEPAKPVFNEFAAYAQDDWHVSRRFNLSLGLRWDVDPPPHGAHGRDATTLLGDLNAPATLRPAPRGTPLWHTSWSSFAPRLGAAWILNTHPGRTLVLRAGGGLFYGTDNRAAVAAFTGAGFSATNFSTDTPIPIPSQQFAFSVEPSGPFPNTITFAFPPHMGLPYTWQWNVSLEKALGRNQALTASYVGVAGRQLLDERIANVTGKNSELGDVGYFPRGLTSNYQGLELRFQRTISPGVQALAAYTWSHTLDYGSTDPRFPLTHGDSDFDVRQNFQAALVWNMRQLGGGWIRRGVLSGWGVDGRLFARTAFPITPLGNLLVDPITGEHYYSGTDFVRGRPLYLHGSQYPGGRAANGGPEATNPAFDLPTGASAGDAPRNMLRGFGDFQVNVALSKTFHIYNRLGTEFRAGAFNVTNHPDLGYVDPHLTDELFGQSTLMLNQSLSSTGPSYQQGAPRSLQFSVKLTF